MSYYSYLISTPALDIKVRRRFSDFAWLRERLCEIFPGVYVNIII
jgi:hypothetical protein